jgi:hypothetical protein
LHIEPGRSDNDEFLAMLKSKPAKLLFVAIMLFAVPALSQSCALCYTQAAASGARFIHSLRDGILVLIVPPMFMSIGITWLAYRKRNEFGSGQEEVDPEQIESDQDDLEQ